MFRIRASQCGKIMGKRGLGKTGESYVKEFLTEQRFKRTKEFRNKYTDKGIIMEDEAIDVVADHFGYGMLLKNEESFENDFMKGTPDVIMSDTIIDVKNSWSPFTFPFFEECIDTNYYWQGQVYMELTGKENYQLIYVLLDTPEHLIEKEAYFYAKDQGYDELDEKIYDQFKAKMTYSDIPIEDRIKRFSFERNQDDIDLIIERVKECRELIETLK